MTTSTSTARKTTTKKAAPAKATKAAPAKAAPTPAARKLRWRVEGGDRSLAGKVAQSATVGDRTYAIERSGDAWAATVKVGRKTTTLVEGTFAKAYAAIQAHHKSA